jgi:cAMP-binding proteins - catabolite gene activator and regulatory subunit of cAMP-dependent protein kinases
MDINLLSKEEISTLSNCFLLNGIDIESVINTAISEGCHMREFSDMEIIKCSDIGIIISGAAKVRSLSGRHKLAMRRLAVGDIFGVSALFSGSGYVTEISSSGNCKIVFLTQELLERLMKENYLVADNYIHFLSERIRFLNRKIACLAAGTVEEMLSLYLLYTNRESIYIDSFSGLAEELGVGRASLYRSLDKLEDCGYISRSLHEILVLDKNGLETLLK